MSLLAVTAAVSLQINKVGFSCRRKHNVPGAALTVRYEAAILPRQVSVHALAVGYFLLHDFKASQIFTSK